MQAIHFSSFGHGMKFFCLMSGLGVFFAAMAYLICRYPSMRRAQFREWGPHPVMGLVIGGAILASFLLSAWNSSFACFYSLEKAGGGITLHYYFPARQETITCGSITKTLKQVANPKSRYWELALFLKDGKIRRSAPMAKEAFENATAPLGGRLCPDLSLTVPAL